MFANQNTRTSGTTAIPKKPTPLFGLKPDVRDWLADIANICAFNQVDKFEPFIFQKDVPHISREEMRKASVFASYVYHAVNQNVQLSSMQKEIVITTLYETVAGEKKASMSDVICLATYINTCNADDRISRIISG